MGSHKRGRSLRVTLVVIPMLLCSTISRADYDLVPDLAPSSV
jgi:hypothetical protein